MWKSRVKVCTSHFNTFYSAKKRKIPDTLQPALFWCPSLPLPRREVGSSWKRISGQADCPSIFLTKTWTFCPSFRQDRIPAKSFRRRRGKCATSSLSPKKGFTSLDLTFIFVIRYNMWYRNNLLSTVTR